MGRRRAPASSSSTTPERHSPRPRRRRRRGEGTGARRPSGRRDGCLARGSRDPRRSRAGLLRRLRDRQRVRRDRSPRGGARCPAALRRFVRAARHCAAPRRGLQGRSARRRSGREQPARPRAGDDQAGGARRRLGARMGPPPGRPRERRHQPAPLRTSSELRARTSRRAAGRQRNGPEGRRGGRAAPDTRTRLRGGSRGLRAPGRRWGEIRSSHIPTRGGRFVHRAAHELRATCGKRRPAVHRSHRGERRLGKKWAGRRPGGRLPTDRRLTAGSSSGWAS